MSIQNNRKSVIIPRLNVLFASHRGFPWGGISTDTENILLSELPQKTRFVFIESSPERREIIKSGKMDVRNILASLKAVNKFRKAVITTNPDIVHISTANGLSFLKHSLMVLIAKSRKKAVVLQPHCSQYALFNMKAGLFGSLWNRYINFVINKCDTLAVLSQEWLPLSEKIKHCEIRYIPNGIDLSPYQQIALKRCSFHNPIRILFLGHIGRPKGIFDLVKAIEIVKHDSATPFHVDLTGNPNSLQEVHEIEEEIEKRSLSKLVALHGAVYGEEKMKLFENADIFVIPSHHEGMPMAVIEAMAAGLPVIGTDVGGIPDLVIHEENGLLVPIGDPKKLSDALCRLINDPELGVKLGKNGFSRAKLNFDIQKKAEALFQCYQDLYLKVQL